MSTATLDNLTDQLQSKVFQNLVDLADVRNCRLVSQKWKRIVMEACKNKFHVVYPLTDSTLYAAHDLKDVLVSFDVYAFSGKENKDKWVKSGIEPFLQATEWLQFSGSEVSFQQIQKIIGLAINSLKMVSFKCFKKDLTRPFQETQQTFSALRKLSIGFYCSQKDHDSFATFTNTLERWSTLDSRVQLPVLESLNLYFDSRSGRQYSHGQRDGPTRLTSEDLFRNYLAIAKLLLKYKQTLREIQIERIFNQHFVNFFEPFMFQSRWTELVRGLEGLDELNLSRLKLSTRPNFDSDYNFNNFKSGIEVFGRPKSLKNVLYQNLIVPFDCWPMLIGTLSSLNNADSSYLTSVKINLSLREFPDPTMVINLGTLRECRNLRTLWLNVNILTTVLDPDLRQLFVRNVELLHQGISVLRFEHSTEYHSLGKDIFINQQQIRWIIDNLRGLESFWVSLVITEETNENNNNGQIEAADADDNEIEDAEVELQEVINRLVNIDLDTFRDLIAMPKLKNLQVDIVKARSLAIALRQIPLRAELNTGSGLFQEYSNLCGAAGYTTTTTVCSSYDVATLKMQKS